MIDDIVKNLGDKADYLLKHECKTIAKERLHAPGGDWVNRIFGPSDRNNRVLNNLDWMFNTGRLAGTRAARSRSFCGAWPSSWKRARVWPAA